jgi:serine O-acetyltransferase
MLLTDVRMIRDRDPAAKNWLEVLMCYPGLQAILWHRGSHRLYRWGMPIVPRLMSHIARWLTGIEIHPGAKIGRGVFIDHGMGVVIGETAIVGNGVTIYQGVTLGGTRTYSGKRHPTIGNKAIVGAGANVLGNIYIGERVKIGAGSVVLKDIPSDCTVVGVPGRIIYPRPAKHHPNPDALPDTSAEIIKILFDRIRCLEQEIASLQQRTGLSNPDANEVNSQLSASNSDTFITDRDRLIEDFLDGAGI